jgi:hypothetical protein
MIEAYSKYRTRDLFKETLQFRYFDFDHKILQGAHAGLNTKILAMFNRIHELRVSLLFEDALPFTVRGRIEAALADLKREWNEQLSIIESHYGWKLKSFPLS